MNALIAHNVIRITVCSLNESSVLEAFVKNAVGIETVNSGKFFVGIKQCTNSSRTIAVLIEIILLTVDDCPFSKIFVIGTVIVVGTIEVHSANTIVVPYARSQLTVFLKSESHCAVI